MPAKIHVIILGFAIGATASLGPFVARAQDAAPVADGAIESFQFERPSFHCAYDAATGRLMTAEYDNNQVTLYNLSDKLVALKQIPAPAHPSVVLAKQFKGKSYFIVGGIGDRRIDVFAAKSGERTASVQIQTPHILHLDASRSPDDPYVFYISLDAASHRYIGRFSLATGADDGVLQEGGHCRVTADGSGIYIPSGEYLWLYRIVDRESQPLQDVRLPPGAAAVEPLARFWNRATEFTVDPNNVRFAIDTNLLNPLAQEGAPGSCGATILGFAAGKPWVFAMDKGDLRIVSSNDASTRATLPLFDPSEFPQGRYDRDKQSFFTRPAQIAPLFVDDARRRIIVSAESRIAVVNWEDLDLPDEPLVGVDCPAEVTVGIGAGVDMPVQAFDPRVTVKLESAPAGATFKNGRLTWKPTGAGVGAVDLKFISTFKEITNTQTTRISVGRESIPLPFACEYVVISPDGKLAVAWSQAFSINERSETPGKLVLVDVAARKVLATADAPQGIFNAQVNSQGVFVLGTLKGGDDRPELDLIQLKLPDLSPGAAVKATGGKRALSFAGDKYLWASGDLFTLPDLTKIYSSDQTRARIQEPQYEDKALYPANGRVDDGWYAAGAVWDEEVAHAELLLDPPGFVRRNFNIDITRSDYYIQLASWGRKYNWEGVQTPPDRALVRQAGEGNQIPTVLRRLPAAAMAVRGNSETGGVLHMLSVHELVDGVAVQTIPLVLRASVEQNRFSGSFDAPPTLNIAAGDDVILACAGRELVVLPVREIQKSQLPAPMRIRGRQDSLVLANRSKVSYDVLDGVGPFEVQLNIDGEEFAFDSKTDNIVAPVDGQLFVERALQGLSGSDLVRVRDPFDRTGAEGDATKPARQIVDEYLDAVGPLFRALTGKNPRGVPMVVGANLSVTDKNQNTAQLKHYFLLDLRTSDVILAIEADPRYAEGGASRTPYRRAARPRPVAAADEPEAAPRTLPRTSIERKAAIDYGNKLRKEHPPQDIELAELKHRAAEAQVSAAGYLVRSIAEVRAARRAAPRAWSDRKGHATQAALASLFADRVLLKNEAGGTVTVPIEKLSDADQQFLKAVEQPDPSELEIVIAKMTLLGQGMREHDSAHRGFPPAFIAAPAGKPLLSWRVAILPYIGSKELFDLFRLDQPWSSAHNRALLPYMPAVFDPAEGDAADRTTMLTLRHPRSVFGGGYPVGGRGITDGYYNVATFVEVLPKFAMQWTRPEDVPGNLAKLKLCLQPRAGGHLVGSIGGPVRLANLDAAEDDWLSLIDYADQAVPADSFREVNAVADDTPRKPLPASAAEVVAADPVASSVEPAVDATAEPAQAQPRVKAVEVSIPENAPVGTVVATATPVPPGYTYRIDDEEDGMNSFEVHPTTGVITVVRSENLDADDYPNFYIKIVATNARGEQAPVALVVVNLGDENEPPDFVHGITPIDLSSYVREGDTIGLAVAFDPDNDKITYKVVESELGDILRIGDHGHLSAGNPRDINQLIDGKPYKITITADDGHGHTVEEEATVTFTRIN